MSRPLSRVVNVFSKIRPSFHPSECRMLLSRPQKFSFHLSNYSRQLSFQADRKLSDVLSNEIEQEKENMFTCGPPKGFAVTQQQGTKVILRREYPDGVVVEVDVDLAGSVVPNVEDIEQETVGDNKKELQPTLDANPDIRIRLIKPSGKSVIFNCSLPSSDLPEAPVDDPDCPTYSVDSVEVESVPGYFTYSDLFDDNMYDNIMRLLLERQLDAVFQNELQKFCTSEEHKLYLKFLNEFHAYCRE